MEVKLHASLISTQGGGEWQASVPGRFIPTERATILSGWVGRRDGPNAMRKISCREPDVMKNSKAHTGRNE
jgi:hypothetical protein